MLLSNISPEYLKVSAWSVHGRENDKPVPVKDVLDFYTLVLLAFALLKLLMNIPEHEFAL